MPLNHEINLIFFNEGPIFTPEVFIPCKKVWGARFNGLGTMTLDIPHQSFTVERKIHLKRSSFFHMGSCNEPFHKE